MPTEGQSPQCPWALKQKDSMGGTVPRARELPPLFRVLVHKTGLFLSRVNAKESGQGHVNFCQAPTALPLNHTVRSFLGFHSQVTAVWKPGTFQGRM